MSDGTLTWREAREALTAGDRYSANEAQDVLDDLARPGRTWSFLNAERNLRWMQYAGLDDGKQPLYRVTAVRPGFEKENT